MASAPPPYKVILAYLAVYLIWGSTYLAIRYAVETIPPFFMAGVRFLIAGGILYAWLRLRGASKPTVAQWLSAGIIGFLLLMMGNGLVSWAEQTVPSGVTALIIAIVPVWFVSLDWLMHAVRPTREVVIGLILGMAGMIVLIDPARLAQTGQIDLPGAIALIVATIAWAFGSMYARTAVQPERPLLGTAMQMLSGGVFLLCFSGVIGELWNVNFQRISLLSLGSVVYLIVFGALIAFSAYIWLLRVSTPARVSTYAYVNPIIAVFLGWLIGGEEMTGRIALAAIIIVSGVVLITMFKARVVKG